MYGWGQCPFALTMHYTSRLHSLLHCARKLKVCTSIARPFARPCLSFSYIKTTRFTILVIIICQIMSKEVQLSLEHLFQLEFVLLPLYLFRCSSWLLSNVQAFFRFSISFQMSAAWTYLGYGVFMNYMHIVQHWISSVSMLILVSQKTKLFRRQKKQVCTTVAAFFIIIFTVPIFELIKASNSRISFFKSFLKIVLLLLTRFCTSECVSAKPLI